MLGSEAADEWRTQRRFFLKRFFLISRAAFEKLERAKHWTAIHFAQTVSNSNPSLNTNPNPTAATLALAAVRFSQAALCLPGLPVVPEPVVGWFFINRVLE